jgi:hypothetical protein
VLTNTKVSDFIEVQLIILLIVLSICKKEGASRNKLPTFSTGNQKTYCVL